jgi:hypothetical protein
MPKVNPTGYKYTRTKHRVMMSLTEMEYVLELLRHDPTIGHGIDMKNGDEKQIKNALLRDRMINAIHFVQQKNNANNELNQSTKKSRHKNG